MCFSSLFKSPKVETPQMPSAPVQAAVPAPAPTKVDAQSQQRDFTEKRRKRLRSGLLSTIKKGGVFGSGAELASVGSEKQTLG